MDLREKLAGHLYRSALALSPMSIPVARLAHPSGLTWELGTESVMFRIGGGPVQTVTIDGVLADLLADLAPFGVTTTFLDLDLLQVPTGALIKRPGSTASSDTDALEMFTSALWTILDAYAASLTDAEIDLVAALEQLYMNTADGELLDVWGGYFGIPRKPIEVLDDPAYYARIVREVLRPRVNRYAIEAAIFDDTGLQVSLREPHKDIFRLSVSPLSGDHHLQDGRFFTYNVFQPIYHSAMTVAQRARVLEIIERNRPAGCLIVGADVQPPIGYAEGGFGTQVSNAITLVNNLGFMSFSSGQLSASLALSNSRELINSDFKWTQKGKVVLIFGSENSMNLFVQRVWDGGIWNNDIWIKPSVSSVVTQHPA